MPALPETTELLVADQRFLIRGRLPPLRLVTGETANRLLFLAGCLLRNHGLLFLLAGRSGLALALARDDAFEPDA